MNRIQSNKVKSIGDIPNARFGHTFTLVNKSKAVLFGGAISENGKFIITNQTYLHDFITNKWKKLTFENGIVPSERAAHASAMISDLQMAVYGGAASGTQGLLKDDLYILDLRKQPTWKIIQMTNKHNTPGQRYGHTMVYSKPYLIIFGGNTGNKAQNDVWLFHTQKAPFVWIKYQFQSKLVPCPRVYHSAALCQQGAALGMMVVFGGRRQTKKQNNSSNKEVNLAALNDIWGLRKHRDGSWDWVCPPKSQSYIPLSRYQHLISFLGSMMIVIGGRTNMPQQATSLMEVYNTQTSEWHQLQAVSRYRHAIVTIQNNLFLHGGFQPELASHPLQTMVSLDLSILNKLKTLQNNNYQNQNIQRIQKKIQKNSLNLGRPMQNSNMRAIQNSRKELRQLKQSERNISNNSRIKLQQKVAKERDLTPSRMLISTKNIRLSNQVTIATGENHNMMIQKVPVNNLLQQSKRLTQQSKPSDLPPAELELIQSFLTILLPNNGLSKSIHSTIFAFKKQKIIKLCQELCAILTQTPSLIYLRSPVKVIGSLYGRYYELLRLFQNFGTPDDHQMETFDYVFLGNYVDKGYNSLELICLLFSLKLKHPQHIILLRGCHQDSKINRLFGLAQQCAVRLGQNINEVNSVYNNINKVFDLLPLAAVIQDKILCVHSGVGNMKSLNEIQMIQRPISVHKDKRVIDLLWSSGLQNKDIMNYAPSKVNQYTQNLFLEQNSLSMIIRSKQCIQEGYKYEGNRLSIFSVSNYARSGNNACILKINKNLEFAPCVLQPSNNLRGAWINDNILKTGIIYTQQEQQLRKKIFSVPKRK